MPQVSTGLEAHVCCVPTHVSFPGDVRQQAATIFDTVEHAFRCDADTITRLLGDIDALREMVARHLGRSG